MWIEREISKILPEVMKEQPILVLTGSRQVGKTSLLKHSVEGAEFVSLDIPKIAEEADESGQQFLARLKEPVIIDEVQYAPKLFRYLKVAADSSEVKSARFLLTGSEKFSLMNAVTESLAGRCSVVELQTLSHVELENWSGNISEGERLLEWILKGGYPALHARELAFERFYTNLIATYLERDVKRLSNIQNLRDFDKFLRILALRSGQMLSMNSIASDLGISQGTIKSWIGILLASNIVSLVEPWNDNPNKRLVKTPKLFFNDTGLLCALLGFSSVSDLRKTPLLGALFETHVFAQLLRSHSNTCKRFQMNYFRTHEGAEIDFVLSKGNSYELYECKWSETPDVNFKSIDAFKKYSQSENVNVNIVCSARGKRTKFEGTVTIRDSIQFN
jgi:uncharacterized protein